MDNEEQGGRRVGDSLPPEIRVVLAEIRGELRLISQQVDSKFGELSTAIRFGDTQNAQAITGLQAQINQVRADRDRDKEERAEEKKATDARIQANRTLIYGGLVLPLAVIILAALILAQVSFR